MNFDDGAVQRNGLDLDTNDLFLLQLRKKPIQDAGLGPAAHAGVDGMPVAEPLR